MKFILGTLYIKIIKKLMAILNGNKPLLLDKMRYTEHPLAKKFIDSSIYDYIPNWTNNNIEKTIQPKKIIEQQEEKKENLSFDTF